MRDVTCRNPECGVMLFKTVRLDAKGHRAIAIDHAIEMQRDGEDDVIKCAKCGTLHVVASEIVHGEGAHMRIVGVKERQK